MTIHRRKFIQHFSAVIGGGTLSACGGGDATAEVETQSAEPLAAEGNADQAAMGLKRARPAPSVGVVTPPPVPAPAPVPSPSPAPVPPPAAGLVSFALKSATASTAAPFCVGHAFRKGAVPAGTTLVGNVGELQVTPKNRWPDGSLKFAIVAGRAPLAANAPATLTLALGRAAAASDLTTAHLAGTGLNVSIGAGSYGSAQWTASDWATPFQTWVSGPFMSSWIYRKPIGTDKHLVAWLEVRAFAGGEVEVLPWIENGYLKVAGPTNKQAQFTFTMGGTQRFSGAINLSSRCRTPLLSGSATSYWLKSDPGVIAKVDTTYLQTAGLVPSYSAKVPPNAAVVTALPTAFTPLQQGSFPGGMGAGGYHPSIGLLPEWDVLYLTSEADAPFKAIQFNAFSAGRYGIHFRDEATNRPLKFSAWPNLSMTGGDNGVSGVGGSSVNDYTTAATGPVPPAWASSHHPSVGYLAYLVTGRFYFMEELQFAATSNYLKQSNVRRQQSAGIFLSNAGSNTVRGMAWAMRTLFQAASATPDDDPLSSEFLDSVRSNIGYLHARYVAKPNNPFGWVTPYSDYTGVGDGAYFDATWMQDFVTAAFGHGLTLDLRLPAADASRLGQFFSWKAQSIVGRFGGTGPTEFLYRDAAPYTIAVAPTDSPNFEDGTGPWFANWGALYDATYKAASPGARVAGPLRGAYFPDPSSYWGNLMPALSYAVEHNVPGAREALQRLSSESNWGSLLAAFNGAPVWGVMPRGVGAVIPVPVPTPAPPPPAPAPPAPSPEPAPAPPPAPYDGPLPAWVPPVGSFANLGTHTLLAAKPPAWPNSDSGGPFANWSSAVYAPGFSALGAFVVHGSGHLSMGAALWGGTWCFDLDTLKWVGRNVPGAALVEGVTQLNSFGESAETATAGHPYPPHTYDGLIYQPPANGGGTNGALIRVSTAGAPFGTPVHRFDLSSSTAAPRRVIDAIGGNSYPASAADLSRNGFWYLSGNGNGPLRFVSFADWSIKSYPIAGYNQYGNQSLIYLPAPWDCLVGMGSADSHGANFGVYVCPIVNNVPQGFQRVSPIGAPPADRRCGGQWSTILSCIVSYEAAGSKQVHRLRPPEPAKLLSGEWGWSSETLTGVNGATPSRGIDNGAWGRFVEVPAARCFIWCDSIGQPVQAWRLSGM